MKTNTDLVLFSFVRCLGFEGVAPPSSSLGGGIGLSHRISPLYPAKHTESLHCDCSDYSDCTPHEQNPGNSTEPAVVFIPVLNRENCILHWNENKFVTCDQESSTLSNDQKHD
jgi:hypothetical protein